MHRVFAIAVVLVASTATAGEPPVPVQAEQQATGELRLDVVEGVEGMRIVCGGDVVDRWDVPFPLPVGKHWVEVSAPGYEKFKQLIEIEESGAVVEVTVPPLVEEGSDATHGPRYEDAPSSLQFVLGSVVGGLGLVGVGFGLGLGVLAKNKRDDAAAYCPIEGACLPRGVELIDEAQTNGNIATGLTIAGGALLVGGIVMWVTAPSIGDDEPQDEAPAVDAHLRTWFGPGAGGVTAVGRF